MPAAPSQSGTLGLPAPPLWEPREALRIRPGLNKTATAYRNPSAAVAAAQLCMKRLHPLNLSGALKDGAQVGRRFFLLRVPL